MGGELRTWEPFDQGGTCHQRVGFFQKNNLKCSRGTAGFMKHS